MARSAALTQRLVQIAASAAAAGRGKKGEIYDAACAELGISRATLMRTLSEVIVKPERKRRSDAGTSCITRDEAVIISGALMASLRKSATKRLLSVEDAVDMMRANGEIRCERVDQETGELFQVATSTIIRALRTYRLHPDQLLRPEPAVEMRSLHPNHVWQIDASLCVLYYLKAEAGRDSGLQVMEYKKFYKNKPAHIKSIESDRVWSYEVTDHFSSAIAVHYVNGAESGVNLADSFIRTIVRQSEGPLHGVPFYLMMDPGSANTAGTTLNLLRRLQVKPLVHMPGNARTTGQVENARNIIERSFESGLRFTPVRNIEELNARAQQWADWYNATKVHSRHHSTRTDLWLTITPEQLRIAPDIDTCRMLLTHEPEARTVDDHLRVSFAGQQWDVSAIPRVMIGEKLQVTYNPYHKDSVFIVDRDEQGEEILYAAPCVERALGGFATTANIIGEEYRRPAATEADNNRREVDRAVYGATTDAEVDAAKKAKALPFGGRINAMKRITETDLPTVLPRRGTALDIATRTAAAPESVLTLFEAATELARRGVGMDADKNRLVKEWYPDGVPETALDDLQARLTVRSGLRVVGGTS